MSLKCPCQHTIVHFPLMQSLLQHFFGHAQNFFHISYKTFSAACFVLINPHKDGWIVAHLHETDRKTRDYNSLNLFQSVTIHFGEHQCWWLYCHIQALQKHRWMFHYVWVPQNFIAVFVSPATFNSIVPWTSSSRFLHQNIKIFNFFRSMNFTLNSLKTIILQFLPSKQTALIKWDANVFMMIESLFWFTSIIFQKRE